MEDLPPPGSKRRRIVLATWVCMTVLFAALMAYGLYAWITARRAFPWLAAVGAVGSLIAIWRWIRERSRTERGP
jgi:hypothetical protein